MAMVDLLVLAAGVVGVTLGALRGFVPQVTGVFGLGGGLFLAARYHEVVRVRVIDPNSTWAYNGELAFISIIVVTIVGVAFVGWLLRRFIESTGLGTYDRVMGGALGGVKAGATAAAVLLGIVYFAPDNGGLERAIGSSRSGPALWRAMDTAAEALPDKVGDRMEDFLDEHDLPDPSEVSQPAPDSEPEEATPYPYETAPQTGSQTGSLGDESALRIDE
ncbi:MAG: CvpA family protein [Planctomycetota bacterium]|jgi:membrane protein required for colicin V production